MTETREIKAGTLIEFTSGEYSDFRLDGAFVALQDISPEAWEDAKDDAQSRYKANDRAQDEWTAASGVPYPQSLSPQECFVAEVIRRGYLLALTVREIHLGSYFNLDAEL